MEVADANSVLGNFDDASFDYFGTKSRFFTRDGQYFVETDNAQGSMETFRVSYTFGWFPLQQYLIEFPDGRMQALGISWDSRPAAEGGQRWYHQYPQQHVDHKDPLHWTGAFQNWNSRCAACHSTQLRKNYSQQSDRYSTTWKELNVGCEACHGPGSQHIEWAKGSRKQGNKGLLLSVHRTWTPTPGALPIPQNGTEAMSGQLQVCAGCHSRRGELGDPEVTTRFADNFMLSPLLQGLYFPDGQIREEVYEMGSFLQSRMHQNRVSCTNCHEPHSGQLQIAGNGLCLQCHQAPRFRNSEHAFHKPDSPGAQCVNCHMPQRTYMGVDTRHDHSFRVPDPAASVLYGVPNACTQCHTNRDDRWAAGIVGARTGRTIPAYPHTALLTAARNGSPAVLKDLLAYASDRSRPPALQAIALLESGPFASATQQDDIRTALGSPDPMVRIGAASALTSLDASQRLRLLQPLLGDPVRSVRVTAARQLIDLVPEKAPEELRGPLTALLEEYRQTLLHNADMPESMSDLGLFYAAQGNPDAAEMALLHARKLAPRYLAAMLNLADLYRARNRDDLGEKLLDEAVSTYPDSGDVHYTLGLLYVRTGRTPRSVSMLKRASELSPDNPQYLLAYSLALVETGRKPQALAMLKSATARFPADESIQLALKSYGAGLN